MADPLHHEYRVVVSVSRAVRVGIFPGAQFAVAADAPLDHRIACFLDDVHTDQLTVTDTRTDVVGEIGTLQRLAQQKHTVAGLQRKVQEDQVAQRGGPLPHVG